MTPVKPATPARTRTVALGAALATLLALAFALVRTHQAGASAPALPPVVRGPNVRTAKVILGTITHHVSGIGHIVTLPGGTVATSFPEAGRIAAISVAVGQTVQSGQLLARLDTRQLALHEAEAQATLAAADAAIVGDEARVHGDGIALRRERALLSNGVAAQRDVDVASQQFALDRAALAADRAKLNDYGTSAGLELSRAALANAVLRAPIAGVVTAIAKSPGEWANPGDTIAKIVNPKGSQLLVSVPAAAARDMVPGDLVAAAGATASVLHVVEPLDPATQMAQVVVAFHGPAPGPIGAVLEAEIQTGVRHDVTIVPISAIVQDPVSQAYTVFVREASGSFRPEVVTPGWTDGPQEQVQSPNLSAHDVVATYGSYELLAAQ